MILKVVNIPLGFGALAALFLGYRILTKKPHIPNVVPLPKSIG
jgi:hypothetical protein